MRLVMKINEDGDLQLEQVYSGILLKTDTGQTMGICMRDGGFEFSHNGVWYSANLGEVKKMATSERGNILVEQNQTGSIEHSNKTVYKCSKCGKPDGTVTPGLFNTMCAECVDKDLKE